MKNYFLIYHGRVLIRYEALFYYGFNMDALRDMTRVAKEDSWESVYLNRDGVQQRYVVIESIPEKIRSEFNIPESQQIRDHQDSYHVNLDDLKKNRVAEIKLFISNEYNNYMFGEDKISGTHFMRFVNEGYTQEEAKIMTRTFGILSICLRFKELYSIEFIYHALAELIKDNKDNNKYQIAYPLKSLRTFYNHMRNGSANEIESVIVHGLTGKPSNNGKTVCKATVMLVTELLKHFNHLSDNVVTNYANTIITAMPKKYNNGRHISRSKVNQIKNGGDKNVIKAAIHGKNWLRENYTRDVHRVPTQYPLDCVEVDFTKVHASLVDNAERKVKKFICRIKDRCTKAILGSASGRSECFELFQIAFRRMLEVTGNKLAAEFVYDPSPAFGSDEFERIKGFIENLGIEMNQTGNPQAKGGIESHFKTLFEVYLPQHVGSLGGNVASTKKHRPKREILVLLEKVEYLEDEEEWDNILKKINNRYNTTPQSDVDVYGPIQNFRNLEKPHAVTLDEQYVAYVSWHHTQRKFMQSEFLVEFDRKDYHFGWEMRDVNESPDKQKFIKERTGDLFDIFMHPERPGKYPLFAFEVGTLKMANKFPLLEMYYGNKIDQKIDPNRRGRILDFLAQRSALTRKLKRESNDLSKEVKNELGVDLNTVLKEITKNGETSVGKPDTMEQILEMLRGREAIKIDPFTSTVTQESPPKKRVKQIFKPTKIKH